DIGVNVVQEQIVILECADVYRATTGHLVDRTWFGRFGGLSIGGGHNPPEITSSSAVLCGWGCCKNLLQLRNVDPVSLQGEFDVRRSKIPEGHGATSVGLAKGECDVLKRSRVLAKAEVAVLDLNRLG